MLSPDSPLSTSIQATCDRLKQLTQLDLQSQWRICQADLALEQALDAKSWADWSPANLNQRHHIAWIRGQQTLWLGQVVTIQPTLQGYPLQGLRLKLALTWWAELAEIYVDGVLRQCGDLFDCSTRLNLASAADLGQQFTLLIRLRSPGHDDGALVSSQLQFESNFGWDDALTEAPEPAYCGAEIHVLAHYLQHFQSEALPKLGQELADLDWQSVTQREPFDSQLQTLRDRLSIWSDWLKQRTIGLVGHAHLDLAWLWPIRDTWVAAERTFESVLALCEEFPELIFTHSTPALYAWLQAHRPELFARIQTAASQGKWDVAAGLWVEPDLVLTSGEAIARQILYGQHYTQAQFGRISRVAWLPDSFGFTQQLPQLLRQGGIDYFVTQKLRWNDTTQFPHTLFNWQAPDGTASFSMMSAPIGRGIDPVELATYATDWEQQTGSQICLWLPGVGDHGGGPTRDMLETVRRWQRSPLFPRLEFMGVHTFLEQLEQHIQPQLQSNQLATWSQDLYLELHRGCYTTHAEQKWLNRRTETTLCEAEIFASLATLLAGYNYPKAALEEAWKQILFNQFHDILPGSAIPEVFTEANPNWEAALATAQQCRDDAIAALAQQIHYPAAPYPGAQPVLVFNSLNWERSELVTVSYPLAQAAAPEPNPKNEDWVALTEQHEYLPCQITSEGDLLFQAMAIPSVGYRLFWLCERSRLS
ncbi:MAG: alpha-mannosidase, partial [Cyanobacteria bacterium P01_H01_bin.121]